MSTRVRVGNALRNNNHKKPTLNQVKNNCLFFFLRKFEDRDVGVKNAFEHECK